MEESFLLTIDAKSTEEVDKVNCSITAKVKCTEKFAISTLVNFLKQNQDLKHMFMMAMVVLMETEERAENAEPEL
jgi:hypothetical protein